MLTMNDHDTIQPFRIDIAQSTATSCSPTSRCTG